MNFPQKKLIFKTIAFTILIEIIIAIIGGMIIYYNYDKLTASASGISKTNNLIKNIETKKLPPIQIKEQNELDENVLHHSFLGKIESNHTILKTKNSFKEETSYSFLLKDNLIQKRILLNYLNENKILDRYIFTYINNTKISDLNTELKNIINLGILLDVIKLEDGAKILKGFNEYNFKYNDKINSLIESNNYTELAKELTNIELSINEEDLIENLYGNTGLTKDERFQYIISKLYDKKYYNNIKKVSREIGIDQKLIISAIAVEQLRFLTTDRGYAKNLIKNNRYLTNFTKFSYGLGGIKTHTFNNINLRIKQYNNKLYSKYFKEYNDKAILQEIEEPIDTMLSDDLTGKGNTIKNTPINNNSNKIKSNKIEFDETKIKELLEDHYTGTLYVGGLIYSIEKKRAKAGFPIYDKPGVILTLYNMGNNKTPHKNPDMGGSLIPIKDGKKLYFGEIGFIYFNYLKYYLK